MSQKTYDIIILGAGPAGLTAGIYTARIGLKTLILEGKMLGGRAIYAPMVENFPGFPDGITGAELTQKMTAQTKKFGAELKFPEEVININLSGEIKTVNTKKEAYQTRALIISTGTQRKKLQVPGEMEFLGQGVSYCSICDGAFFKGLEVTVIGSGDEAANDALFLTKIVKKVTVISSSEEMEMSETLREKLEEKENLEFMLNSRVEAIEGDTSVKAIKIVDTKTNKQQKIPTDGVFVSLGNVPMTQLVQKAGIEVDQIGCIKVDRQQRTNIEGVFAAGDCTCGGMQMVAAAGEGATAAIRAATYVKRAKKS
jgi:thioredoxin reductase (NADPH)